MEAPDHKDGVSILRRFWGESQDLGERFLYWSVLAGFQTGCALEKLEGCAQSVAQVARRNRLSCTIWTTILVKEYDVAADHPDVIAEIENFMKDARTDSCNGPIGAKGSHA